MLAAEFDFDLPDDLIAQHPVEPREHSRLMVIHRRTGRIEHHRFSELPAILDGRDILARNNSRVIPARLIGHRESTGGKWEGLFLREVGDGTWEVLASTRGRPSIGERVVVGTGLSLRLESRGEGGTWLVRPLPEEDTGRTASALALLERHGQTPLPPYIRKGRGAAGDRARYQTVFALRPGSVAAPTAGLHFSEAVFQDLAARGIGWVDLTLHVGLGTFRPMDVEEHRRSRHAFGMGRDLRAGGCRAERQAGQWRPGRGCRHYLGSHAGNGRRRGSDPALHGPDRACSSGPGTSSRGWMP